MDFFLIKVLHTFEILGQSVIKSEFFYSKTMKIFVWFVLLGLFCFVLFFLVASIKYLCFSTYEGYYALKSFQIVTSPNLTPLKTNVTHRTPTDASYMLTTSLGLNHMESYSLVSEWLLVKNTLLINTTLNCTLSKLQF